MIAAKPRNPNITDDQAQAGRRQLVGCKHQVPASLQVEWLRSRLHCTETTARRLARLIFGTRSSDPTETFRQEALSRRMRKVRIELERSIADYSGKDLSEISHALQLTIDAIDEEIEARYEAVGHDV